MQDQAVLTKQFVQKIVTLNIDGFCLLLVLTARNVSVCHWTVNSF